MYERMMDLIEDQELIKLAEQVDTDETVKVSINELRARVLKTALKSLTNLTHKSLSSLFVSWKQS